MSVPQNNPSTQSSSTASCRAPWGVSIAGALIALAGTGYSAYSSKNSNIEIQALKTKSEEQIAKMKADTERELMEVELRAQENIIRLKAQLDADKESRTQRAADESAARSERISVCSEMKSIRDGMSSDIIRLRNYDNTTESAIVSLEISANKIWSYLTNAGLSALKSSVQKDVPNERLAKLREHYDGVLQAYNEEIRVRCNR